MPYCTTKDLQSNCHKILLQSNVVLERHGTTPYYKYVYMLSSGWVVLIVRKRGQYQTTALKDTRKNLCVDRQIKEFLIDCRAG